MIEEIWKDIQGYKGLYQVSNLGRVRSLDRVVTSKDQRVMRFKGQILKCQNDKGYLRVDLSKDGLKVRHLVHRLLAIAFIPNPNNYTIVNHLNGVPLDNQIYNLEWTTDSGNQQHQVTLGLSTYSSGQTSRAFKGPILVFNQEGQHIETLYGNQDMKAKGFDPRNVSAILRGKGKTYKGCTFKRITQENTQ